MANTYDIELEKAELPTDPQQEATEILEDRYEEAKHSPNGVEESVDDFIPLVRELSEERPELLASLVTELYAHEKRKEEDEANDPE